jgi:hypothetical protein
VLQFTENSRWFLRAALLSFTFGVIQDMMLRDERSALRSTRSDPPRPAAHLAPLHYHATVGLGEVQPLSPVRRLFAIGLIIGGVSIAAYSLGSAAQFVVSGDWQTYLQERRRRMLEQLNDHVIVCGYGRVGKSVVHPLCTEKL